MFLDDSRIPSARLLEANYEAIAAEVHAIPFEEFEAWVVPQAYVGDWRVFGIWHHSSAFVFADHVAVERRRLQCPVTRRLIRRVPGLLAAGVSWLGPGCHILPHTDEQSIRSARIHLGIDVNDYAHMRVGGETRRWVRGRCFALDSGALHEVANEGTTPRVALILEQRFESLELPLLPEEAGSAAAASSQ
jgi:aspartyl/asparaginyl beta-hydroxylase (cupin superfamily)